MSGLSMLKSLSAISTRNIPAPKRFGMDGGEAVIPALEQISKARQPAWASNEAVIGMAHRGRLNVLHNVLQKPFRAIVSEFLRKPCQPRSKLGVREM